MPLFAVAVFLGAYLLFGLQPLLGKFMLPIFGGGAGVWALCLAFFQVGLLVGYVYAHFLTRLAPRWQVLVHGLVLLAAGATLSLVPEVHAAQGSHGPFLAVFLVLARHAGPPYLAVAATAPLLQHWLAESATTRSPYRLYAVSNAGAFLGLLAYPFLIEPALTRGAQAAAWTLGYAVFALATVGAGVRYLRAGTAGRGALPDAARAADDAEGERDLPRAAWAAWLALPACTSALLVATTSHISEGVAPVPLLWVLPLALHLASFVWVFRGERWSPRVVVGPLLALLALFVARDLYRDLAASAQLRIALYAATLFAACVACHGELYRLRPRTQRLTAYYVAIAAGGAAGGLAVSVLAPLLLDRSIELQLGLAACLVLFASLSARSLRRRLPKLGLVATSLALGAVLWILPARHSERVVHRARNFYGSLTVVEDEWLGDPDVRYSVLYNGRIRHGAQFERADLRRLPTAYFTGSSGVGLAMLRFIEEHRTRNVGVIGLGIGTLAAYANPEGGDRFRFYELNPQVIEIAQEQFHYLGDCGSRVELVAGDARLSLVSEADQAFDLLVLDAFTGDAIPVHLLTREAFETYLRHLAPDGILAAHVTSSYVNLLPVLARLAEELHLYGVYVTTVNGVDEVGVSSTWALLSRSTSYLQSVRMERLTRPLVEWAEGAPLWTDERAAILDVLY